MGFGSVYSVSTKRIATQAWRCWPGTGQYWASWNRFHPGTRLEPPWKGLAGTGSTLEPTWNPSGTGLEPGWNRARSRPPASRRPAVGIRLRLAKPKSPASGTGSTRSGLLLEPVLLKKGLDWNRFQPNRRWLQPVPLTG